MLLKEKPHTADEFWAYAGLPENAGRRLELVEGMIIEMSPSKPVNTVVAGRITIALGNFVYSRNLGWITVPDGGFELAPNTVRQPDVGFISLERMPNLPQKFKAAPDLAVEVVSPDEDIFSKAEDYLHAGTQQVWAVYPDKHMVYVFTLDADGTIRSKPFGIDDTLDGGSFLPGFTLPVREIFPATQIDADSSSNNRGQRKLARLGSKEARREHEHVWSRHLERSGSDVQALHRDLRG